MDHTAVTSFACLKQTATAYDWQDSDFVHVPMTFPVCWWGRYCIPHVTLGSFFCKLQVHLRDFGAGRMHHMHDCCATRTLMTALTLNSFGLCTFLSFGAEGSQ